MADAAADLATATPATDDAAAGDAGRAEVYALLAALLSAPPDREFLDFLQTLAPAAEGAGATNNAGDANGDSAAPDIDALWRQLRDAAAAAAPEKLDDEYHALFIGLGRGEVVAFGSWHLTGFLMEQPLSDLRDDMKSLGLAADAAQKDPEDHIAALCESMALIIRAADIDAAREKRFFARHIEPWAGRFFAELQVAKSAVFYRAVGALGARFVESESRYLHMAGN
ncbi:MAG: molecular chaperone TorD family protein [Gammaproteobacteria bacterium]|nr:molecular chaperone TorD family protein [Gammaproteobacteria bacterium]